RTCSAPCRSAQLLTCQILFCPLRKDSGALEREPVIQLFEQALLDWMRKREARIAQRRGGFAFELRGEIPGAIEQLLGGEDLCNHAEIAGTLRRQTLACHQEMTRTVDTQ